MEQTIYTPSGEKYITLSLESETIRIRLHRYEETFSKPVFLVLDRKAIPEIMEFLELARSK